MGAVEFRTERDSLGELHVPADASSLYARNLLDFLKLIITKEGALNIDLADDIVAATLLARDGEVTRKA